MTATTQKELKECLLQLDLTPNSIVFVDRNAVDMRAFEGVQLDFEVSVIPVRVPPDKTVRDCVTSATLRELREWADLGQ